MAGEVAQIEQAIGTENLAKTLAGLYNQWWIQRNNKESEWRELRNYLFATDTTTTSNSSLPWKNKTTLPKLTQIRDNLHANYMDALFPNDNWMKWEGATQEATTMKKRKAIEAYMKTKLKESKFREEVSLLVYDYIDYGNAFGEVMYVNDSHVDPITEETINEHTCLANLPELDLLIRTGGDFRISNFLLWQAAYAELYFTDTLWPDFDEEAFNAAIDCYDQRERRFGQTGEQVKL